LSENQIETPSLVLEKQVLKKIPLHDHDVMMNWILTEKRFSEME
jgi:5-formyltetrahydrofolate cyclo-ligase